MYVRVQTLITQQLEVPEGSTKQDVLNFLAEWQSFNDAFAGVSDAEQQFRITSVSVVDEEVVELGEECFDEWLGNRREI